MPNTVSQQLPQYNQAQVQTQMTTPAATPPVQHLRPIKRVIRHPLRACISFLTLALILITCLFVTIVPILISLWIKNYKLLTQETLVAEIKVSPLKKDENGNPYFEVTYSPVKTKSALQGWLGLGNAKEEEPVSVRLAGDRFRIEADFFRWGNLFTSFGLKPMFKVVRIAGDYTKLEDYNTLPHKAIDISGGPDNLWKWVKNNAEHFQWLGNAYIMSVGQDATYHERTFKLFATEDGLILKAR